MQRIPSRSGLFFGLLLSCISCGRLIEQIPPFHRPDAAAEVAYKAGAWYADDLTDENLGITHGWLAEQAVRVGALAVSGVQEKQIFDSLLENMDLLRKQSDEPDHTENDPIGPFPTFLGHFYDPYTETNYRGASKVTAMTRFMDHTERAQAAAVGFLSGSLPTAMVIELGRASHYFGDMCEPHHVTGRIAGQSQHLQFELYFDQYLRRHKQESRLNLFLPIGAGQSLDLFPHDCALFASHLIDLADAEPMCSSGVCPTPEGWEQATRILLPEIQMRMASFLVRFANLVVSER